MLSRQPVLISESGWASLCQCAERLAAETHAMEAEICVRPELHEPLGIPKSLRLCLNSIDWSPDASSVRTLRFDFHPVRGGWAVSEVNSDVPGGYTEASLLPVLFAKFRDYGRLPPSPLSAWGDAMEAVFRGDTVVFISAPGYLEDHQVIGAFMRELAKRRVTCYWRQSPSALKWERGAPSLADRSDLLVDGIVRFYQAEWLCELRSRSNWQALLSYTGLLVNPTISVFAESKRLPLVWSCLTASSITWREMLPECCDTNSLDSSAREEWVLKAAYSNTGDSVMIGDTFSKEQWNSALRAARKSRGRWVAQRRFYTTPLESVDGPVYPCIGVFVINGRAAGAYVRLSRTQLTNGLALEAPLFIKADEKVPL